MVIIYREGLSDEHADEINKEMNSSLQDNEDDEDELTAAEKEEEYFRKHDSAAKFQFNYNRVTTLTNDHPEINVQDKAFAPLTSAPGEGKIPISLLQDPKWDKKSHPHLDPTGKNNLNKDRKVKLSNLQFCDQRLKNCNPKFSHASSYFMAMLSYIQNKQLNNNINISVQRGYKKTMADGSVSYHMEDAHSVFDNVTGTHRYESWKK